MGCRRLGDLLGYDFGLCFALGGDSGGGQLGGLLGGGIVRQLLEDFGQVITRSHDHTFPDKIHLLLTAKRIAGAGRVIPGARDEAFWIHAPRRKGIPAGWHVICGPLGTCDFVP